MLINFIVFLVYCLGAVLFAVGLVKGIQFLLKRFGTKSVIAWLPILLSAFWVVWLELKSHVGTTYEKFFLIALIPAAVIFVCCESFCEREKQKKQLNDMEEQLRQLKSKLNEERK